MNTMHERLKAARKAAGFADGADAARTFGWAGSTYAGHENGSRLLRPNVAERYARAFKVRADWLLFGGPEDGAQQPEESAVPTARTDLIPVYNVAASAGHGAMVDSEVVIDRLEFPPGYIERITKSHPRNLAIISVKGESMIPTLHDDDVVMIDTTKRDLSYDGLFVIRDNGDGLLVKRIGRASQRGYVMMIPDNKAYPTVERRMDEIDVVGKVIWAGKKM